MSRKLSANFFFLIVEPSVQEQTGKRSHVLVTCAVPMFDSDPQGDVASFLFQMTHVFQSPDHCQFPGKLEENNITHEPKRKSGVTYENDE